MLHYSTVVQRHTLTKSLGSGTMLGVRIIDPGHIYGLMRLDGLGEEVLTFVKREGPRYPGNVGHHAGTTVQEVLRALVDRVQYVDNQISDSNNVVVLSSLRRALWHLEARAAQVHGLSFTQPDENIELMRTCATCGHVVCLHKEKER